MSGLAPGALESRSRQMPVKAGRPFVRFAARLTDSLVAYVVLTLAMHARSPLALNAYIVSIAALIGWIFIEAFLLVRYGTTPGKWILRTRVEATGGKITYWKALDRSFTVFTMGLGCNVPTVNLLCIAKGYYDLTEAGSTVWDRKQFEVIHENFSRLRYVPLAVVDLFLLVLPGLLALR
jgi:hypothetical protein